MDKLGDYTFTPYAEEDIDEIVTLESHLWGNDFEANKRKFIWKHRQNPFLRQNVGIVARYEEALVGFRGFTVTDWQVGDLPFSVLSPSDVVVHPHHRRKGLFAQMNRQAMQWYHDDYRLFVNLSSNRYSTPGYIKLGWKPIAHKTYLKHICFSRLLKNRLSGKESESYTLGRFEDIEVTHQYRADEMSELCELSTPSTNAIQVVRNELFFHWKLTGPHRQHVYYYHYDGSDMDAYVILTCHDGKALVYDFEEKENSQGIAKIITFILKENNFIVLYFIDVSLSKNLRAFLDKTHFYDYGLIDKIRMGESYGLPFLIRPVKEVYGDEDWYIEGVDTRDIAHWIIRPICSDK
jgi:GNAT superfamily N-acetyltransferase